MSSQLIFLDSTVKMPLMALPVRSVVAPLSHARVLISPGSQLKPEVYRHEPGVTDIVAPNLFHLAGVPKAMAAYNSATVWGVPGAEAKHPEIKWSKILTEEAWPYHDELSAVLIGGMPKVNEVVFVHKASRTLILTDLCFNVRGARGFGPKLIFSLFGTYERLGVSRFFASLIKDKQAFAGSLQRLFTLDFDNIVVSHGQVVNGDAKQRLKEALAERGYRF